jgi:hypothetical protein
MRSRVAESTSDVQRLTICLLSAFLMAPDRSDWPATTWSIISANTIGGAMHAASRFLHLCILAFGLCQIAEAYEDPDLEYVLKMQFFFGAYDSLFREPLEASLSRAEIAELNRFVKKQNDQFTLDRENYKNRLLAICAKRGVDLAPALAEAEFDLDSNYRETRIKRLKNAVSNLSTGVRQKVEDSIMNISLSWQDMPGTVESAKQIRLNESEEDFSTRFDFACNASLLNDASVPQEDILNASK